VDVSSIESDGTSCHGVNGYSDIDRNTQVIVRNGRGDILGTTPLGDGHGDDLTCTFSFSFPVTQADHSGLKEHIVNFSVPGRNDDDLSVIADLLISGE